MKHDCEQPMLLLVGVLAACIFLVAVALDMAGLQLLIKGIPAIVLGLWVWRIGADRRIALGLWFGALGDIFLNIPAAFLPGMLAFAIGHGLYVLAFWRWQAALSLAFLVPIALYLGLALSLMLPGTGELSVPVAIYMCIIGAMIWRASVVASEPHDDWRVRWLAMLGALLFAFSDTLIGINKFVSPLSGVKYPIILAYWAGQFLIGASAVVRRR